MTERLDTRERVLIVDDARENINNLTEALYNRYAISVARDGDQDRGTTLMVRLPAAMAGE